MVTGTHSGAYVELRKWTIVTRPYPEVATDGAVFEYYEERVVAPVRWSNAHIVAWLSKPGNEKFAGRVSVPSSLMGRDIVRMSPSALQNLCGGDAKLAAALHNRLRDEIARCSKKS